MKNKSIYYFEKYYYIFPFLKKEDIFSILNVKIYHWVISPETKIIDQSKGKILFTNIHQKYEQLNDIC